MIINNEWVLCSCSKFSQHLTGVHCDCGSLLGSKAHLHAAARLDASSAVAGLLRASAKAFSFRPPSAASLKACSSSSVPEIHTNTRSARV